MLQRGLRRLEPFGFARKVPCVRFRLRRREKAGSDIRRCANDDSKEERRLQLRGTLRGRSAQISTGIAIKKENAHRGRRWCWCCSPAALGRALYVRDAKVCRLAPAGQGRARQRQRAPERIVRSCQGPRCRVSSRRGLPEAGGRHSAPTSDGATHRQLRQRTDNTQPPPGKTIVEGRG